MRVKFNSTTLKGVEIISQAVPVNTQASTVEFTNPGSDSRTCKTVTFQNKQSKNTLLVLQRGFSIAGEQYQTDHSGPMNPGMRVAIDARKENKTFGKLVITNKRRRRNRGRIWNFLKVTDEGKRYIHYENEVSLTALQNAGGEIIDVSAIVFGNLDIPVEKVRIIRRRREVMIQYEPRCEKTGLRDFRPGPTQTRLYSL